MENKSPLGSKAESKNLTTSQPLVVDRPLNSGQIYKVPVVRSYLNAEAAKSEIYKDNANKTGVYRWTNLLNNKFYIGSSINLKSRYPLGITVKFVGVSMLTWVLKRKRTQKSTHVDSSVGSVKLQSTVLLR